MSLLKRKKININSRDYIRIYGGSFGKIQTPFYETVENIGRLIGDGIKVSEHTINNGIVELTKDNYDKDNDTVKPVPGVEVSTVQLTLVKDTLVEEETTTCSVTVLPSEADNKTVTYTSEHTDIATVDKKSGVVTAVKAGSATIVATSVNAKVGKAQLTVNAKPVEVATVELTLAKDTLVEEETTTCSVTVLPSEADNKTVTYTSEHMDIATVDRESGVVTAVKAGSATIVATSSNNKVGKAQLTVEAKPVAVTNVTLTLTNDTLNVGETTTCQVVTAPEGASGTAITYSSESDSVATVEQDGTVTAAGQGTTNIVATSENGTVGKASITVNEVSIP